jgi:serine/threonine-protein kinase RsbW
VGAAADPVNVRFALTSRPENVRLVRELLAGVGSAVRLGDATLDDAMIAVSEASNNAVMHAYGGAEGPLELDLGVLDGRLEVRCRDYGHGIPPGARRDPEAAGGFGLAAIKAFTDASEITAPAGAGTMVRMTFSAPAMSGLQAAREELLDAALELDLGAGPRIAIAPSGLAKPILSRLARAVGAQAGFTIDRLSDTQLVIDALTGSGAPYITVGGVVAALANERRRLELRIGPLSSRGVEALSGGPPYGSLGLIMGKLTERCELERCFDLDMLTVVLTDRRPPA